MAAHYVTDADGTVRLEPTTFAQRKAARIAAGSKQSRFVVRHRDTGTVVGEFSSRREAEEFAFERYGSWNFQVRAADVLSQKIGWVYNASFVIERA